MKCTGTDLKRGHVVCAICRDRVFVLSEANKQTETKCLRCHSWTVAKGDFVEVKKNGKHEDN